MGQTYRRGDQALVREINLSTVLRCLKDRAPLSRAGLSALTGLNKTTVSSLVEELLDRGLITELGLDNSAGGRPATLLDLNPEAGWIIGVALGVDFASVILSDFVGRIRWRRQQATDPASGKDAVIAQTLALVDEAIAVSREHGVRLLGLGLATPGTVDLERGLLIFSPNLQWRNVPFREIFQGHTGLPVRVDNDANAAAIGEHFFGAGRQARNFINLFGGVGVGSGLFLNGELYRGSDGFAGEIGHTNFLADPYHSPCRCGNRGCWETYVNQDAIIARIRARLAVGRNSLIPRLMAEQNAPLSFPLVLQAAEMGDTEALETLSETGALLGLGIANLISIFNPELVIIGGPLSLAGPYWLPRVEEAVQRTVLPEVRERVRILLSPFGADASVVGAAALIVEDILAKPGRVERSSRPAEQKGGVSSAYAGLR